MKTITLRNLDDDLKRELSLRAQREGASLNRIVLKTLKEALLPEKASLTLRNEELARLAGRWEASEAEAFDQAVRLFSEIDEGLWK